MTTLSECTPRQCTAISTGFLGAARSTPRAAQGRSLCPAPLCRPLCRRWHRREHGPALSGSPLRRQPRLPFTFVQEAAAPGSQQLPPPAPATPCPRGAGAGAAGRVPQPPRRPARPCPLRDPRRRCPALPASAPSSAPTAGGNGGSLFNSPLRRRIWIPSKRPLPLRCSEITGLADSVKRPTLRSWKECAITALSQETGPLDCSYQLPPSIFFTWNIHFWWQLKEIPLGICYTFSSSKIQSVY